eukprot:6680086-Pyramimonas_sp.AAC.1
MTTDRESSYTVRKGGTGVPGARLRVFQAGSGAQDLSILGPQHGEWAGIHHMSECDEQPDPCRVSQRQPMCSKWTDLVNSPALAPSALERACARCASSARARTACASANAFRLPGVAQSGISGRVVELVAGWN